jgi:polysaccharide pyruvyl transferase WcaK-like protein
MSVVYFLIPSKSFRGFIQRTVPWIKTVAEADIVADIRGGDSFSDIYGLKRFFRGFFTAWTCLLIKGSIVQLPQTYGPFNSWLARSFAKYLLRRSCLVIARDEESRKVALGLVRREQQVLLSPDVAFSLEPMKPDTAEIAPLSFKKVIGLNVNGLVYNGGYTKNNMFNLVLDYPALLLQVAKALLSCYDGELWLIPHTYAPKGNVESDNEACRSLYELLPPCAQARTRVLKEEYDCHELKWIIGQCELFIGSRMHSCIAALSQGVPCVGIAYSMKFKGVFESVNMADWVIDARSTSLEDALETLLRLAERRTLGKPELKASALKARERIQEVFTTIILGGGVCGR